MTADQQGRGRLALIHDEVVACRRCPRLVAFREQAAAHPKPAYAGQDYWARPVPGFGDPDAGVYVLGLATAAHGGNRTGRAFTGNATADWLVAAMHRAGLADRPTSAYRGDGLRLTGAWMASAVRCAPPQDRPTLAERRECARFLDAELAALTRVRVIVCLGALAWAAAADWAGVRPRPAFGHGREVGIGAGRIMLGCYHPSPQNTRTGRLTEPMLDEVLRHAASMAAARTGSQSETARRRRRTPMSSETTPNAGSLGDQHITGSDETGEFATGDEATGQTPAHGSSNAGVNETGANRPEATMDEPH